MTKHVYVLVTDGVRGLFVQDTTSNSKKASLISHKVWPNTKAVPTTSWPAQLVRYVTFGLLDVTNRYEYQVRPFGLPHDTNFVVAQIQADELDRLEKNYDAVRNWQKYNANVTSPWKLKFLEIRMPLDTFDLQSAQCIKAFLEMNANV